MKAAIKDIIRHCIFRPWRKGPVFYLTVWDAHRVDNLGKSILGYELKATDAGHLTGVLFTGEDFGCSPMCGIDSDEAIKSIMGFLTLRPSDTDTDYFADYTDAQEEYCAKYAEALGAEIEARFH